MQESLLGFMGEYGNIAVFLLILAENLFPPIPSEAILTFGGVLTTCTSMTALGVILSATAGSLAGAAILYLAGRMIPGDALERIFSGRDGRASGFSREDVELARMWFLRRGAAAVFFCRLLPIVRSLVSIPAGMAGMRSGPFFLLTAAGSLIWNTVLVLLGREAGRSWERAAEAWGVYADGFLMVLGTGLLLAVLVRKTRKNK